MMQPGSIENGVLFGHEGELYLAHGGHSVLEYATGRRQVAETMFSTFEANMLERAAKCTMSGAKFLHVIFPDKQSVVRNRFPYPDPICLGSEYRRHCPRAFGHVLDLTDLLRADANPVFKRTDTHLNDYGLALAASSVAGAITGTTSAEFLPRLMAKPTKLHRGPGDLGTKLSPALECETSSIVVDWKLHFATNGIGFGNDGLVDLYLSPDALRAERILWFGDSFGRGCVRLLSLFFREIVFLRTRFLHDEMVFQLRPDIVITQNAERYLDVIASDDEAQPFLLYPAIKRLPDLPDERFTTLFAALLSYPRPPYRRLMERITMPARSADERE